MLGDTHAYFESARFTFYRMRLQNASAAEQHALLLRWTQLAREQRGAALPLVPPLDPSAFPSPLALQAAAVCTARALVDRDLAQYSREELRTVFLRQRGVAGADDCAPQADDMVWSTYHQSVTRWQGRHVLVVDGRSTRQPVDKDAYRHPDGVFPSMRTLPREYAQALTPSYLLPQQIAGYQLRSSDGFAAEDPVTGLAAAYPVRLAFYRRVHQGRPYVLVLAAEPLQQAVWNIERDSGGRLVAAGREAWNGAPADLFARYPEPSDHTVPVVGVLYRCGADRTSAASLRTRSRAACALQYAASSQPRANRSRVELGANVLALLTPAQTALVGGAGHACLLYLDE